MIRIATRLGIIACRYLVKGYYENKYISAPEIAEHYNMNVRALMPSLRQLTHRGILHSRVGGSTPGFIFAKDPKELTLYQILITLEGESHFECCKRLIPDLECNCIENNGCSIFSFFHKLIDNTANQLSAITIAAHAEM